MRKKPSRFPLLLVLIGIVFLTLLVDYSGILKTQVLQSPEILSRVKLIRQKTDPIQFDIYYDQLLKDSPSDISIILVNSLVESSGRYSNIHQIIERVLLQTGSQEIVSTSSSETVTIKNIQKQQSTKLGTIVTRLKRSEYISLEYDTLVNRIRTTLIDSPVPFDFPLNYHTVQNPTSELLYVSSPGFHTILSQEGRAFVKAEKVRHGALLMPNAITTLQDLDSLSSSSLISQPVTRATPPLIIEQNQIVLPAIPSNDLNTLIVRYRSGNNTWEYQSFLLSATKDITLATPLQSLMDFYTEVEYGFAYISNGLSTLNLQFPFNSLLPPEEFPVYYRTDFVSLAPELAKTSKSLNMDLTVSIAPKPDSIAIGVLTREPLLSLADTVEKIEQKIPLMIFEGDSAKFSTWLSNPTELPFFNLIGKNDQIWSQKVNSNQASLISEQFQRIALVPSDRIPELESVNQSAGDKLICLLKTDTGSYSLATISSDLILTTACLQSARRAGFTSGRMYPVKYDATLNQLVALRHYDFDANLSSQVPLIKNYDPKKKSVALNNTLNREKVRLMVSAKPDFATFSTQPVTLSDNTFTLPLLANCQTSCYFKVASIIREDQKEVLGYASETLLAATTALPIVHACFTNEPSYRDVFDPKELSVQLLRADGAPVNMTYRPASGCYEFSAEQSGQSATPVQTGSAATPQVQITSLEEFLFTGELLPGKSFIVHSNGLVNSHIHVPPQRHYFQLRNDSLQQALIDQLTFEQIHLRSGEGESPKVQRKKSYQINVLGNTDTIFAYNAGNLIIQSGTAEPAFLKKIPVSSPLNETLLFPSEGHHLSIPNTIRFLPSDEVALQGFREEQRSIVLQLPVPERSSVKMFLENVFRPNVQVRQLIKDGIQYREENGFITLENPTGLITIPIRINVNKPTDVKAYQDTFPTTPIPEDIDIARFQTQLMFLVTEPANIPSTSLLTPLALPRAQLGADYQTKLSFGGIESADSFQLGESRFLNEECKNIFTFDPKERTIKGKPPLSTKLEACFFQISVRYLLKLPYGQIDVTNLRSYRLPLLEATDTASTPVVIQVPIRKDTAQVSQTIAIKDPLEEVIETTVQFLPKGNQGQLISSIGELAMTFSPANQQFIISGDPKALTSNTSRFIQGIRKDSGKLVLMEFQFIPVQFRQIDLPIVQDFPNTIDVPKILRELKFTEEEMKSLTVVTDSLTAKSEVSNSFVVKIFGLPELNDQVFSAILEKKVETPSALVEFDRKLQGATAPEALPPKIRVDFRLKVKETPAVTLATVKLKTNKNVTIDLSSFLPAGHELKSTQIPSFFTANGSILTGKTPEPQELSLLIQDFTDVKNYILPIQIVAESVPEEIPTVPAAPVVPTIPDVPVVTKPAADADSSVCFPDITDQPLEYQDAICLAKESGIIEGSGGLFKPDDPINRAEISKILVTGPLVIFNLLTSEEIPLLSAAFSEQRFPDVPSSAWYFGFVETVREVQIFSGHPDGSFKPADSLNQAEAAKVIINTLLELQPSAFPQGIIAANTVPGDEWFSPFVRVLNQNGGDLPDPTDFAALGEPITRAQFIYNLLILLDSNQQTQSPQGQ